jgi:ornithine carbamoyltransferase
MRTRAFLDVDDLSVDELDRVLTLAEKPWLPPLLGGQGVAMLFEKPSNRTRSSTELAAAGLGGHPVYIDAREVGIDLREPAEDVARTLACYYRIVCARVFDHTVLERMVVALSRGGFDVPVVNLLSDRAHPCQALADLLTLREEFGPALGGRTIAYVGDHNNMSTSLAKACVTAGMAVRLACPDGYGPPAADLDAIGALAVAAGRGGSVSASADPVQAVTGADAVYTDVWTSMGQEAEAAQRRKDFAGFTVDEALVSHLAPGGVVLHCMPAHRDEEITDGALEAANSRVWRQAFHRRTAMRGLFAWMAGG